MRQMLLTSLFVMGESARHWGPKFLEGHTTVIEALRICCIFQNTLLPFETAAYQSQILDKFRTFDPWKIRGRDG